jgi:hypothetical protein
MKFLLLMYNDEAAWDRLSKPEQDAAVAGLMGFGETLAERGILVASHGLAPRGEAVSVRRTANGGRAVTDGPYAETREVAGGYYVIECASAAEAVEWAKRLPLVTWGVEVRRIHVEQ